MKRFLSVLFCFCLLISVAKAELSFLDFLNMGTNNIDKPYDECPSLIKPQTVISGLYYETKSTSQKYGYVIYSYLSQNELNADIIEPYINLLKEKGFSVNETQTDYEVSVGTTLVGKIRFSTQSLNITIMPDMEKIDVANNKPLIIDSNDEPETKYFSKDGCLLVDGEIKFSLTGSYKETKAGVYLDVLIENNSDTELAFYYDGTVNDWSLTGKIYFVNAHSAKAHSKLKTSMHISSDRTDIKGIKDIESMNLDFYAETIGLNNIQYLKRNTGNIIFSE